MTAEAWRQRMLPLMAQMLVGLTAFFFVVSLVQLTYLHWTIRKAPAISISTAFADIDRTPPRSDTDRLRLAQLKAMALLDAGTTERRYHQTNAALMTRIWTRYMGFVTGMILAMLGAVFLLGRLQEEEGAAGSPPRQVSPGLLMVVLGVTLMIVTVAVNHRIDVTDAPGSLSTFDPASTPTRAIQLPEEPPAPPPSPTPAPAKP